MKITLNILILAVFSALVFSGCGDSDVEREEKERDQKSEEFWDMGGKTDRSKSKGYVP